MSDNHGATRLLVLQEQSTKPTKKPAVQTEAQSRLRKSGYWELHLVSCEFHEGVLTLRGRVSTFYLKQVAQALIRAIDGVGEINNRLEVAERPCSP